MKKVAVPLILFCATLVCVCALLLQPLHLVGHNTTRVTIHVGKTVPIIGIAELAGGYRCYINDDEYFWLSTSECTQEDGEPMRVTFRLGGPITIYRGGV